MKEQWAKGLYQRETTSETIEANASALAQVVLLERLIRLTPEQINESFEDAQDEQQI